MVQQVPALRVTEPQTPPTDELVDAARITCWQSWQPVVAWYTALTAGKDRLTAALRHVAATQTAGCTTVEEKLRALHNAVRALPYIALEMGELSDMPHAADEVLQKNYGDCKDKATLLRALLKAVGIHSDYVLVRTTEHGHLDQALYGPAEFDHVLLAVPGAHGDRFLDATIADAPADRLPPGVEGADALIIRGQGKVVTLPTSGAAENHTEVQVRALVKDDGSATGSATITFTGQSAVLQRGMLSTVPTDQYRQALESTLAARLGNEVAIDTVDVAHLHEPEQPLVISATFSSHAYLQQAGEQLCGALPVFMYQPDRFRSTVTRHYPFLQRLDSSLHQETTIILPTGFRVTNLPAPVHYAGPLGEYRDHADLDGATIHFLADLATHRGLFPPETLDEYRKWSAVLALDGRNQLQFFVRKPDGG